MAPPDVTATSVFVLNAETGQPLYAKNENEVFWILSLTKLVTAYVLVDRMGDRLSETVTIDWPHLVRGSTAGLKRRDVWSLQDLLYGMVLVSGNDASVAIADYTGRALLAQEKKRGDSIKRFVEEMRSAAAALGATHANFADPYGLSPANVATAHDVGLIAASVFTDPRLLPAWACTERTVEDRRAKGADGHAQDHAGDSRRGRRHRRQDRLACRQEYLQSRHRLARAERPDYRRRGLGQRQPSLPAMKICTRSWRPCRAIIRRWREPVTGAVSETAATNCH